MVGVWVMPIKGAVTFSCLKLEVFNLNGKMAPTSLLLTVLLGITLPASWEYRPTLPPPTIVGRGRKGRRKKQRERKKERENVNKTATYQVSNLTLNLMIMVY
jgi:hypothetical protein